tara:strand:- start:30028 stop:30585 length:558 start_codon:yes stop_codon:yes gene_type:complete
MYFYALALQNSRMVRPAFSLIELVIVVVIIGIIGSIAVPRMSSSAENAAVNAVIADRNTLQRAVDLYEVEHEGVMIHVDAKNEKNFYLRLLSNSDLDGTVNKGVGKGKKNAGIYGPYIASIPANRHNGLPTIRIDGDAAGTNTHGWRYDSNTGAIEADHLSGTRTFKANEGVVDSVTGKLKKLTS